MHGNCKRIHIYTKGNNLVPSQYITTTDSVLEASKICGVTPEMISMCLHGKRQSSTFIFKHYDGEPNGKEKETC